MLRERERERVHLTPFFYKKKILVMKILESICREDEFELKTNSNH